MSRALRSLLENHFHWILMYDLFLDNAGTKPSLGEGRLQQPVQKMSQQFRAQGMVHHSKGITNTIFHVIWPEMQK